MLDFDEMAWSHRVSDLAKARVNLSTRFTDWRPTLVTAKKELRGGYESVRPLEPAENQWSDALVLWYGICAIPAEFDPASWADAI